MHYKHVKIQFKIFFYIDLCNSYVCPSTQTVSPTYTTFYTKYAIVDMNNTIKFHSIRRFFVRIKSHTDRQTECITILHSFLENVKKSGLRVYIRSYSLKFKSSI